MFSEPLPQDIIASMTAMFGLNDEDDDEVNEARTFADGWGRRRRPATGQQQRVGIKGPNALLARTLFLMYPRNLLL